MNIEDIYVAIKSDKRNASIEFFINNYLHGFKEETDYYEYPPFFGETEFETDDFREMMNYILESNNKSFRFYFQNCHKDDIIKAMIFINKDCSVFLGLGVFEHASEKYVNVLKNDFQETSVLICNEILPPGNVLDFKQLALE